MTEKRFYYNTFYHADDMSRVMEYEIIDRQSYPDYPNHNEKEDIPNWVIYIGENDSGWQDMLVDLLNALHEENVELKNSLKEFEVFESNRIKGAVVTNDDFSVTLHSSNEAYMVCNMLNRFIGSVKNESKD